MNNLAKAIQCFQRVVRPIHLPTPKMLLHKWGVALLLGLSVTLLHAAIPEINYIKVNDQAPIAVDSLQLLFSTKDTLDLGQLDKFEVHLIPNDLIEIGYQMMTIESSPNNTLYPFVRYNHLPEGVHILKIWQGQDTLNLNLSCIRSNKLAAQQATTTDVQSVWWFQPLLTFCLMLIPFTIVYFLSLDRSRRNLRVEVVRNQIASDLHDDVGVNLSAIKNLTEVFIRKNKVQLNGSTSKIISRIKTYTDETLTKLQDTVWAINPRHDSIEELLAKMKDFATTMILAKGMELQFTDAYNPKIAQKMDMPQRHSMFLMFKESVNNIIKHSKAKTVKIQITNTKKTIDIAIIDDGVGFDMKEEFAGNGLKNFQSRAVENFIDFDLKSEEGEGTAIKMVVYSLQ